MKVRSNYVSNSSSSSFVIYNWFDLSEEKRNYIMNYDENAFQVWKANKIPYEMEKDINGAEKDYPFYGEEYSYNSEDGFGFGWVNNCCRWTFTENEKRNTCTVECTMDNFFMGVWLKYNGLDFDELASF